MSKDLKDIFWRLVYAIPLLGLGIWTYRHDGLWWGLFLALLAIGMLGEIAYRQVFWSAKRERHAFHCTVLGFCGVAGFLNMYLLRGTERGSALIILGGLMVVFFDSFSLLFGKFLSRITGGHKIAPHESPNKTWEGFIGGTIMSFATGIIALRIIEDHFVKIYVNRPLLFLSLSLLPIVAYFGDLNESMAKRRLCASGTYVPLKDFSSLIGPHGGISDRFDAMTAVFTVIGTWWQLLLVLS